MSVLKTIIEKKKESLDLARSAVPRAEIISMAGDAEPPRDFGAAISRRTSGGSFGIKLIAEIKKASPSRGMIREDLDPAAVARIYDLRADAISVITEEDFFRGELGYIGQVKAVTRRPVLRKDFIVDEYQIYESRAAGADAILLIDTAVEDSQAREFLDLAGELGMAVLFEVHDKAGLERALAAGAGIIGINNRDLRTLKIDLETTFELKGYIPGDKTVVSESGIEWREDVLRLEDLGVDAVLVGTSIMGAPDIGGKIDELLGHKTEGDR